MSCLLASTKTVKHVRGAWEASTVNVSSKSRFAVRLGGWEVGGWRVGVEQDGGEKRQDSRREMSAHKSRERGRGRSKLVSEADTKRKVACSFEANMDFEVCSTDGAGLLSPEG